MEDDVGMYSKFVKNYPELTEKARCGYFAVGDGWFTILDTLCWLITSDLRRAQNKLAYAIENNKDKHEIMSAQAAVALAIAHLPVIAQVKEKFGALRFYVDLMPDHDTESTVEYNRSVSDYITFAECMSSKTCETCGKPGKQITTGWIRTLCDEHAEVKNG